MQNGDKTLPSIILDSQGLLVKMVITLESHDILLIKFSILTHFNIVETLVCKTVTILSAGRGQMFIALKPHSIF